MRGLGALVPARTWWDLMREAYGHGRVEASEIEWLAAVRDAFDDRPCEALASRDPGQLEVWTRARTIVRVWLDPRTARSPLDLLDLCHATGRGVTIAHVRAALADLVREGYAVMVGGMHARTR